MKNKVLIIDTDLENCKQIKYNLQSTNTEVYYTHSMTDVRWVNPTSILDLYEQTSTAHKVLASQYGTDDYLTKLYDLDEFLARA